VTIDACPFVRLYVCVHRMSLWCAYGVLGVLGVLDVLDVLGVLSVCLVCA
jgi:hypothetical protein